MTQVFISYSRKDIAFVEQLADDLKIAGFDAWYDLSGLEGGSRWNEEIERAIKTSQYFVVVLSPDSIDSIWVKEEIYYAFNLKTKIVPLMYRPCVVPLGLNTVNFINVQEKNYQKNYKEILRALGLGRSEREEAERTLREAKKEDEKREIEENEEKSENIKPMVGGQIAYWFGGFIVLVLGIIFLSSLNNPSSTPQPTPERTEIQEIAALVQNTAEPSATATPKSTSTSANTLTPTPLPTEITDAKGVLMRLIPAGEFTMGFSADDANSFCVNMTTHIKNYGSSCQTSDYQHEEPIHKVYLDNYFVDVFEVSNGEYKKCVLAGTCLPPSSENAIGYSKYYDNEFLLNYPVLNVTWEMARKYCEWRGARLPTESEWEKSARGIDERIYPWGNSGTGYIYDLSFYSNRANVNLNPDFNIPTIPVASNSKGLSPYGLYNMAGNVAEWVSDWYGNKYYSLSPYENPIGPDAGEYKVIRGGSVNDNDIRTTARYFLEPTKFNSGIGFRCAMDAP